MFHDVNTSLTSLSHETYLELASSLAMEKVILVLWSP
jgi:hypothetical protein